MTAGFKPDIKNHFNVVSGGDLDPAVRSARLQEKYDQGNLNQAAMGGRDLEDLAYVPLKGTESFTALKEKEVLQNRKQKEKDSRLTQQIMRQIKEQVEASMATIHDLINDNQPIRAALDDIDFVRQQVERLDAEIELLQDGIKAIDGGKLNRKPDGALENAALQKMLDEHKEKNGEDLNLKDDLFLRSFFANRLQKDILQKDFYETGGRGMEAIKEEREKWQRDTNAELDVRKQKWQDILDMPSGAEKDTAIEKFRDEQLDFEAEKRKEDSEMLERQSKVHDRLHTDPNTILQNIDQFKQEMTLALSEISNSSAHSQDELDNEMVAAADIGFESGFGSITGKPLNSLKP